jgi:sugar O-acyltransferase (sialic acid O-acetyltransferase NeuD family)
MPIDDLSSNGMPRALLIVGAGGHGRVVADSAVRMGAWACVAGSDRNSALCQGELLPGVPMVVPDVGRGAQWQIHLAIGRADWRQNEALLWGLDRLVSVWHPSAAVGAAVVMGVGCFCAAQSVVAPGARLGHCVIVNHGAVVDHDAVVGDFSHIAPGAVLGGGAVVGARCLIGAGAVLLSHVKVADDVVVGAGSVVIRDVCEAGAYVGSPARRIR